MSETMMSPSAPVSTRIPFNDLRRGAAQDTEMFTAVERVILSGRYLLGEETAGLERELASYLGTAHVVCVASGTNALELALASLDLTPGQEVLTAANAGGYAALAARRRGLRVRYADVDEDSLLLTPTTVELALSARTRVVVVTHLYGRMADVAALRELCHARDIRLLEDCAQAAGARAVGGRAGSIADAAAFSFYPTKNLGALGDGGAVATSDERIAERIRQLRQYGWGARYRIERDGGVNSRIDELQAALLRARLRQLDERNRARREIARRYAQALASTPLEFLWAAGEEYVAHLAVVRSPQRTRLAQELAARGIATAVHYPIPDHRQAFIGVPDTILPVTEAACTEVLSLPCFPELETGEVDSICTALHEIACELER
jgi:aminotransferase EvaB